MTGKQNAVMWMGLILIGLRLFTTSQWKDIWSTILKGSGSSSSGGGLLNINPLDPLLPGPLGQLPGILGVSAPTQAKSATANV